VELSRSLQDVSPFTVPSSAAGVQLSSLYEWGDTVAHRRSVYELNKTCSSDIPDRGTFFTFEEYQALRFDAASVRPDGIILAFDDRDHGQRPVGLCQLTCPPGRQWAFVEMTGVLPAYRRQGVATAMKRRALVAAADWGCLKVRTLHHPRNAAIIAANRALGFRDDKFDL
jgi:RimJ/RimL family protein N-acetyltransferase